MEVLKDGVVHLWESYEWALSRGDERVKDWPLMHAYHPTLILVALYLCVVLIGPRLMEKREPFKLKWILFVYNMGLVALNFHIFYELLINTTKLGYSYSCQPVNYSYDENEMRVAKALYWYYVSKCIEFLDTVFFILRKKNNQVSFLHVYHHATMFPIWWIGIKWVAGGQSFFGAMINSLVHVIMYTYYGVAALGPQYQKFLWWKRYLTNIQLAQFFAGMVYGVQSIIVECAYPKWMLWTSLIYGVTMIALFINFYVQAYIKKSSARAKIQFVAGMVHAAQSLLSGCHFVIWMQYALIIYGMTLLGLFTNFYIQVYIKSQKPKQRKETANGHTANGYIKHTGKHGVANGVENKKEN